MKINDLVVELTALSMKHGNIDIILQGDDEGNSYRAANGADIVVRQVGAGEDDYAYNSMEEAHDDGYLKEELEYKLVIY